MNSSSPTRREFLSQASTLAIPLALGVAARAAESPGIVPPTRATPLRVVCVGGHPDDPESGCAGTLARYADAGHPVTVIYLTRGERGIPGKSLDEAARLRSAECAEACRILGARAVFAGQIDGATEFNAARVAEFSRLLAAEKPDLVFTHWPIDTHPDHQVASLLAMRASLALQPRPELYFLEVNTGSQSLGFAPNTYVDVTPVLDRKHRALAAHLTQNGEEVWKRHHEPICRWRGREAGVEAAEAFFHLPRLQESVGLPGRI